MACCQRCHCRNVWGACFGDVDQMHVSSDESVPGWGCCCHSAQGCWPLAALGCTALERTHMDGHHLQAGPWAVTCPVVGGDVFLLYLGRLQGLLLCGSHTSNQGNWYVCCVAPQNVCECARTCTVQPPRFCFAVGCQHVSCSVSWPVTNLVQASAHDRGPCLSAALADIPSYFQSFFLCVWSEQCSAQHCRLLLLVFVVFFLWMLMLLGKHTQTHIARQAPQGLSHYACSARMHHVADDWLALLLWFGHGCACCSNIVHPVIIQQLLALHGIGLRPFVREAFVCGVLICSGWFRQVLVSGVVTSCVKHVDQVPTQGRQPDAVFPPLQQQ